MIHQYISMLTKYTTSVRQDILFGLGLKHNGCFPYYYTTKQKDTAASSPPQQQKFERDNHCKQFTTIGKILNKISKKSSGTDNKISIIGLDEIGVATVFSLVNQHITDNICIIDLDDELLKGELIDLQMGGLFSNNPKIIAGRDPSMTANSKICLVFTGTYRGRDEHPTIYVGRSVAIIKALIPAVVKYSPDAIIIIASDPVDILAYSSWKISDLPKNRVIGTGTMIDTARFRYLLSQKMGISPLDCHGHIIGEKGENSVPVWSNVNIAGVPLKDINEKVGSEKDCENWNEIFYDAVHCEETVRGLKGYNSWSYALAISNLCHAIINNLNTVMPVSTHVQGKHSIREDVFLSLPCVIGGSGVTDIVRLPLSDDETIKLHQCAENVYNLQQSVTIIS